MNLPGSSTGEGGVILAVNRLGRKSSVTLLLAGCRNAAFIIGAFFLPVYQPAAGPAGHADPGPDTLAGVDEQGAVAIIAAPLLAVLSPALHRAHQSPANRRIDLTARTSLFTCSPIPLATRCILVTAG